MFGFCILESHKNKQCFVSTKSGAKTSRKKVINAVFFTLSHSNLCSTAFNILMCINISLFFIQSQNCSFFNLNFTLISSTTMILLLPCLPLEGSLVPTLVCAQKGQPCKVKRYLKKRKHDFEGNLKHHWIGHYV